MASPDIHAVTDILISQYKDCKIEPGAPSQPAASDLPPVQSEDIDLESQLSAPEHDSHTIPHDAILSEIPLLSAQPATDDHPPQHQIIMAEDSLLQPTADNQSPVHEDYQCEQSTAGKDDPPQRKEDQMIEEEGSIIEDSQQHDSYVTELLPALRSIADTHSMMVLQHDEQDAVIEEAEPIIDDHPPQQQDGLTAELLPVLAPLFDTHAAMEDDSSQHEEDAVIEEVEPDHPPQQQDGLVAELLPVLQTIADTHSVMAPQHDEHDAVIKETEPVIDDHPPQQQDGHVAEFLPVLQSIADTHSVMKDPQTEAPLVQSTTDNSLLQENQVAQEQQPMDENKYSLQELVSNLMEFGT